MGVCFKTNLFFGIFPQLNGFKVEKILKDLNGVICLMGNILVYGRGPKEHWSQFGNVLRTI